MKTSAILLHVLLAGATLAASPASADWRQWSGPGAALLVATADGVPREGRPPVPGPTAPSEPSF